MKQYNGQTFIHQLLSTLAKESTANQEATQNIVNNWRTLHTHTFNYLIYTHTFYLFNLPVSSNSQIKTESNGNAIHSQCFHFICKFKPFLSIQYVHKLISTLTPPPQSTEWYCITDMALPPSSAPQGNGDSNLSLDLATGSLSKSSLQIQPSDLITRQQSISILSEANYAALL